MNETFTRDDISYWMMLLLLINRPVCLALGLPSMPIIIIGLLFFISNIFQDDLFRYITGKKVIVAWGVLMLYHFINAKFCNVPETNFRVLLNCIQTTILLGFSAFNFILDEKRLSQHTRLRQASQHLHPSVPQSGGTLRHGQLPHAHHHEAYRA